MDSKVGVNRILAVWVLALLLISTISPIATPISDVPEIDSGSLPVIEKTGEEEPEPTASTQLSTHI